MEDFEEEFPRLPPDANPLDPRLMDPRILVGGPGAGAGAIGRFLMNQFQGGAGGGGGHLAYNILNDILLNNNNNNNRDVNLNNITPYNLIRQMRQRFGLNITERDAEAIILDFNQNGMRRLEELQGNRTSDSFIQSLNPNLPLLQLFWQLLFPWNDIDYTIR